LTNFYVLVTVAHDIDICQYRFMPKSLIVLGQADDPVCCSPLSDGALSQAHAELVAPLLRALGDPVRLRLMSLIASHDGGEACVCELTSAFDLAQPTISHHMKVLHEAGLVEREKRGVWVYYRARTEALASLGALIASPATATASPATASPATATA
jgi:ArsR family transcriptional regulator